MPDSIPTGGVETGASSFNLSTAAELALRHSAGMPAGAVREVVNESDLNQGVTLTPEQRAGKELASGMLPDIELLTRFDRSAGECMKQAAGIQERNRDAAARSLSISQKLAELSATESTQLEARAEAMRRGFSLRTAIFHYETARTGIKTILETPEETRPQLSGLLDIPEETLKLLRLSSGTELLNLTTAQLQMILNMVEETSEDLKLKQAKSDEETTRHENDSTTTKSRIVTEAAVQKAYDSLQEETRNTFLRISEDVANANRKKADFRKAASEQDSAKAAVLTKFPIDLFVSSTSLDEAIDMFGRIGVGGNTRERIESLKIKIGFKEAQLRILTTTVYEDKTSIALTTSEIEAANTEIAELKQDLSNAEAIAQQVTASPDDIISSFGVNRSNLSPEQIEDLSTLLVKLSTTMEAKGEARRNLEAAIRQLDQTTESAKQYNAAMTTAMEETRADIEKLQQEAAAAEAQAQAEAEAQAQTEEEQKRQATVANSPEITKLQRQLQSLESEIDQLRDENLALAQTASQSLRQRIAGNVKTFLRNHLRRISRISL